VAIAGWLTGGWQNLSECGWDFWWLLWHLILANFILKKFPESKLILVKYVCDNKHPGRHHLLGLFPHILKGSKNCLINLVTIMEVHLLYWSEGSGLHLEGHDKFSFSTSQTQSPAKYIPKVHNKAHRALPQNEQLMPTMHLYCSLGQSTSSAGDTNDAYVIIVEQSSMTKALGMKRWKNISGQPTTLIANLWITVWPHYTRECRYQTFLVSSFQPVCMLWVSALHYSARSQVLEWFQRQWLQLVTAPTYYWVWVFL